MHGREACGRSSGCGCECTRSARSRLADSFAGAPSSGEPKLGPEVRRARRNTNDRGREKGRPASVRARKGEGRSRGPRRQTFPPARPLGPLETSRSIAPQGRRKSKSAPSGRRSRRAAGDDALAAAATRTGATWARYDHDAHADARSRPPGVRVDARDRARRVRARRGGRSRRPTRRGRQSTSRGEDGRCGRGRVRTEAEVVSRNNVRSLVGRSVDACNRCSRVEVRLRRRGKQHARKASSSGRREAWTNELGRRPAAESQSGSAGGCRRAVSETFAEYSHTPTPRTARLWSLSLLARVSHPSQYRV